MIKFVLAYSKMEFLSELWINFFEKLILDLLNKLGTEINAFLHSLI